MQRSWRRGQQCQRRFQMRRILRRRLWGSDGSDWLMSPAWDPRHFQNTARAFMKSLHDRWSCASQMRLCGRTGLHATARSCGAIVACCAAVSCADMGLMKSIMWHQAYPLAVQGGVG